VAKAGATAAKIEAEAAKTEAAKAKAEAAVAKAEADAAKAEAEAAKAEAEAANMETRAARVEARAAEVEADAARARTQAHRRKLKTSHHHAGTTSCEPSPTTVDESSADELLHRHTHTTRPADSPGTRPADSPGKTGCVGPDDRLEKLSCPLAQIKAQEAHTTELLHSSIIRMKARHEVESVGGISGSRRLGGFILRSSQRCAASAQPGSHAFAELHAELVERDLRLCAKDKELACVHAQLEEESRAKHNLRSQLRDLETALLEQQMAFQKERTAANDANRCS